MSYNKLNIEPYNFIEITVKELKTGDILLFNEKPNNYMFKCFTRIIKYWTKSKYSHCAYVLKDPFGLKGVYIWESSYHKNIYDPLDHKNKFGVQITPLSYYLEKYPGKVDIYVRVRNNEKFKKNFLEKIQEVVNQKPYDYNIFDWISIIVGYKKQRTTKRFWCSALVSYILCENGDIDSDTDWTMTTAKDLSSKYNTCIKWNTTYSEDKLLGNY